MGEITSMIKKKRFIVENKNTHGFLESNYFKGFLPGTTDLKKAYKFSEFELWLASKTMLRNRENYIVYREEELIVTEKQRTLLEELYE